MRDVGCYAPMFFDFEIIAAIFTVHQVRGASDFIPFSLVLPAIKSMLSNRVSRMSGEVAHVSRVVPTLNHATFTTLSSQPSDTEY